MVVSVLGCSGSIAAGSRTTAFLIKERILIDAGTGVGDLTLEQLTLIDDILLTHSHLDHIAAIPLLADTVMRRRMATGRGPIRVHALPATLRALKEHIFNDVIWPDFTALPTRENPALTLHPLEEGQSLTIAGCRIEALGARHTVPALGYAVWPQPEGNGPCWVFTGDTGPNPMFWRRLAALEVGQLIIETAFSDDESRIAERSGHLHPSTLCQELRCLSSPTDVYITHIKPGECDAVMAAIARCGLPHRISALQTGQQMPLG